jgi:hypothetical protein
VGDLRENVKIVVQLDTMHSSVRIVQATMAEIAVTKLEQIIAHTVASWGMTRRVASISKRRNLEMAMPVNLNGNADGRNYESQDVVFKMTLKNKILMDEYLYL